jgi:hypothetical protein
VLALIRKMNKKEQFILYASPEKWFHSALELHGSIEELYRKRNDLFYRKLDYYHDEHDVIISGHSKATYLLMSYTLENLLKGIAVLFNPSFVNKGKIDSHIKTHDLNSLCKLNGFEINKDQEVFQSLLSDQCVSNARYPVGLNEQSSLKDPRFKEQDYTLFETLFEKYKNHLVKNFNELGWDSGSENPKLNTNPGDWNYEEK